MSKLFTNPLQAEFGREAHGALMEVSCANPVRYGGLDVDSFYVFVCV